jgi:hypothetical protein
MADSKGKQIMTLIQVSELAAVLEVTEAEAEAALASVDQEAIHATWVARLVPEVWDKTSPVNHCPADVALASLPFTVDAVAVVTDADTGAVLTFQANVPGVPGLVPMSEGVALAYAQQHAASYAVTQARLAVIETARAVLTPST